VLTESEILSSLKHSLAERLHEIAFWRRTWADILHGVQRCQGAKLGPMYDLFYPNLSTSQNKLNRTEEK
jgi:hypothetical protein